MADRFRKSRSMAKRFHFFIAALLASLLLCNAASAGLLTIQNFLAICRIILGISILSREPALQGADSRVLEGMGGLLRDRPPRAIAKAPRVGISSKSVTDCSRPVLRITP